MRIDCVMHFSASSLVGESMRDPGEYFGNNVVGMVELLRAMTAANVAAHHLLVHGRDLRRAAARPDHRGLSCTRRPPYGESKAIAERMLAWYRAIHGVRYAALRYFNAAGASSEHGEDHAPETHLIPLALAAGPGGDPAAADLRHRLSDARRDLCARLHPRDRSGTRPIARARMRLDAGCAASGVGRARGERGRRSSTSATAAGYSVRDVIRAVRR